MATWTPQTKSASTLTNQSLGNPTSWADSVITWADSLVGWAVLKADVYTQESKSATVLTNQTKN